MVPTGTISAASAMTVPAAIAITGLKFCAVSSVREVAEVVGLPGADEREVGAERFFQQPDLAVDLDGGFSLFDESCPGRSW